jgi:ABC-type transport system substrate-binding protein
MSHEQRDLISKFMRGEINRRTFIRRAVATGIGASAVAGLLAINPPSLYAQALPDPSAPRADGTPAPDEEQVLRMVTPSPFRMDPPTYGGDLWQLQQMVFQGLTRVYMDDTLGPGIADSWESNEDKSVWTFKLNPAAMFSDGTPITGDDVKWTYSWISNPASLSVSPDTFNKIVGHEEVKAGTAELMSGIEVVDPQTVVFTLTGPDPGFVARTATIPGCILKKDNVIDGGEEWWRAPITSGFFKVTEYTPGDQATMTLERNEHWWREPAKLSRIEIALVADPQLQLTQYDNNEIDGMPAQPAEFAMASTGGDRAADLFWGMALATWYFGFYAAKPPFDEKAVRRAYAQAVDLALVSQVALNGIYPPQPRVIPSFFYCGGDEQFQPVFDIEAAKASAAESTYGGVENLPKVTMLVSESGGATALGTWGTVAVAMQQMLQDNLGVEVEVIRKVFSNVPEQQAEAEATEGGVIFRLSFGASLYDPSFISNVVRSDSSANALKYNNPDLDALIMQADAELDEDKRCELYTEIDRMVGDEAVFLAPFRGTSTWFFKPQVRGMKIVNQRVWHSIHEMYIAVD